MNDNTTGTLLKSVMGEPGVADLTYTARGFFAKALIEERAGNHENAYRFLEKAVELEGKAGQAAAVMPQTR